MSFTATVYRVLIASPGDLHEERDVIEEVINAWNGSRAVDDRTVLLPVRWEKHAFPEYGEPPQPTLNRQLVSDCDILIGAFWTRLGTPTATSESGTVEEIEQFANARKPALLYFSSRQIDLDRVDPDELKRVRGLRSRLEKIALVGQFSSPAQLEAKLTRDLITQVRRLRSASAQTSAHLGKGIEWVAPFPDERADQAAADLERRPERLNEDEPGSLYASYWESFTEVLRRSGLRLRLPAPTSRNYARLSLGTSSMRLNAIASVRDRSIGVELVLRRPAFTEEAYLRLKGARVRIERALGQELEWNELPGSYRIVLSGAGFDPRNRVDWARQHGWIVERLEQFNRNLVARIGNGPVFRLTLQQTYYEKGLFNVGVEYDQYVRKADGPIRIRLGRQGKEIEGILNRQANPNRTARIYGAPALTEWFQANFEPMETVAVDLSSEDVIILDKE